jgi:NAD-dependent dihydropyrimidine dehydrogenase PreA subunit
MLGENVESTQGRQRKRLPWFPTIKCEDCLLDLECLNFCPANVFDWDPGTGKPVVARPFDCIPGCRSCAENCKGKNISLPGKKEVAAALKRIRAEDRIPPPRGEGQGWGGALSQGREKKRAKADKTKSAKPGNRSVIILTAGKNKATE